MSEQYHCFFHNIQHIKHAKSNSRRTETDLCMPLGNRSESFITQFKLNIYNKISLAFPRVITNRNREDSINFCYHTKRLYDCIVRWDEVLQKSSVLDKYIKHGDFCVFCCQRHFGKRYRKKYSLLNSRSGDKFKSIFSNSMYCVFFSKFQSGNKSYTICEFAYKTVLNVYNTDNKVGDRNNTDTLKNVNDNQAICENIISLSIAELSDDETVNPTLKYDNNYSFIMTLGKANEMLKNANQLKCEYSCTNRNLNIHITRDYGGYCCGCIICYTCKSCVEFESQPKSSNGEASTSKRLECGFIMHKIPFEKYERIMLNAGMNPYGKTNYERMYNKLMPLIWKMLQNRLKTIREKYSKNYKVKLGIESNNNFGVDAAWDSRYSGTNCKIIVTDVDTIVVTRCPRDPNKHNIEKCESENGFYHGTSRSMEGYGVELSFKKLCEEGIHIDTLIKDKDSSVSNVFEAFYSDGKEKNCANHNWLINFRNLKRQGDVFKCIERASIPTRFKSFMKNNIGKFTNCEDFKDKLDVFIPHICDNHKYCDDNCGVHRDLEIRMLSYLDIKKNGPEIELIKKEIDDIKKDGEKIFEGETTSFNESINSYSDRKSTSKNYARPKNYNAALATAILDYDDLSRSDHNEWDNEFLDNYMEGDLGQFESKAKVIVDKRIKRSIRKKKKKEMNKNYISSGGKSKWKKNKPNKIYFKNPKLSRHTYKEGKCSCKQGCSNGRCGCIKFGNKCTRFCGCSSSSCKNRDDKLKNKRIKFREKSERKVQDIKEPPKKRRRKSKKKLSFSTFMDRRLKKVEMICGSCKKRVLIYDQSFLCCRCLRQCHKNCFGREDVKKMTIAGNIDDFVYYLSLCRSCCA